jgi:uncharacterized protein YbjQ (UPF0145 family)
MPKCKKCNYVYPQHELVDGYCQSCETPEIKQKKHEILQKEQEQRDEQIIQEKLLLEKYNSIILTTEMSIQEDIIRIELISSECIYGINIVKDFFSGIRDIVGGNIKSLEKSLKDAKNKVMLDFKEQAFALGGDAVIAIKIEHTYNNASGGNIMSIFATGTVIKFKV